jgi:hypothetical protein
MQLDTSAKALIDFWEWGRAKGYVRPGTASDVLSAVRAVTEDLDQNEKENFLNLDPAELFRRFLNKRGRKLSIASQREYRFRLFRAIEAYRAFHADPTRWPTVRTRGEKKTKSAGHVSRPTPAAVSKSAQSDEPETELKDAPVSHSTSLTYPFPLRPGITVVIQRLPADLKLAEAERLGAFLKSLAEDYHT